MCVFVRCILDFEPGLPFALPFTARAAPVLDLAGTSSPVMQRRQEQDRLEYAARLQRQRGGSLAGRRWGAPPSQQQGHPGSELGLLAVQPSREQAEAEQQAAEEEWAAVRASKEVQTRVESSRSQPEVAIQETGEEVEQGQQEQQREQQAAKGGRAAVTPRQAPSTVSHSSASPTSSVQQQQQQELEPAAAVAVESQAESVLAGQDAGGGQQHPPRQQQQQPAVAPAPKRERQKDEEMEEGLASQSGQMDSRPAGQEEGGGAAEGAGETEGTGEAGQGHPEQEQEGGAPWELPPTQASQHDPSEQPVDTAALLRQRLLERERLRRRRAEVAERQRRMEERRRQLEQEAAQKQEAEAREVKEKTIVRWQMEQEAERQREGWQQGATSAVLHFAWRLLGEQTEWVGGWMDEWVCLASMSAAARSWPGWEVGLGKCFGMVMGARLKRGMCRPK